MIVSMMSRTIMNTTRTLTLDDPNVTKPFQRRVPAISDFLGVISRLGD